MATKNIQHASFPVTNKSHEETEQFDPSTPPPFKVSDIRAAIPAHCWVKNPWRSLSYVLRDILVISSLVGIALFFKNSSWVWPLYWAAQGTMFWAIFVLGHDCGHGSFSDNSNLNSIMGHILHSSILVPYHGWGGLTTVDRDYGMFNNIHHDIGTHVIHHLFPQIPHYHLIEATMAAKPVLGKYYREPKRSGPIPVHLIDNLVKSIKQDHYVSDVGDVVYYQTDYQMTGKKVE
ncbi:hypothetical protein M8C21_031465 [Ambrosia artemisiifolia]|uniref:Fatty acid desaturase N-terminal domain-containing protein n=1 Tax=Ambrosia artemisiifolia TaxID=4212 RepID=A0AAD5G3U0_AMBAR|nr:hypothetical protein M8C21_031465 [Ambrosia artemisiifolia]